MSIVAKRSPISATAADELLLIALQKSVHWRFMTRIQLVLFVLFLYDSRQNMIYASYYNERKTQKLKNDIEVFHKQSEYVVAKVAVGLYLFYFIVFYSLCSSSTVTTA